MNVELFMENATDDFNADIASPIGINEHDYFLAWFGTKLFTTNMTDDIVSSKSEIVDKVSLREESFGVLMLNRETGKIFKLDCQAADALHLAMAGLDSTTIAEKLGCDVEEVGRLVEHCLK